MTEQEKVELLKMLLSFGDTHQKAPGGFNSSILLQQPGGLFTVPGADNVVVSTHVTPQGIGAMLPAYPSSLDDPRFTVLTGFSDDIGSERSEPCGDAPTGYMKAGTLTASFGMLARQTNTIEISKILHRQRGATTNLRLMGEMLGDVGMSMDMSDSQILDLAVKAEMVSVGVRTERKLAKTVWQGDPAVNTNGYKEFPGLDQQIATGHIDAETGVAMPAVDSMIMDFAYDDVGGTGKDIVEYLSMMEYYLNDVAKRTGMDPVTWAITMTPNLWFELSSVWACRYMTDRCTTNAGTNVVTVNDDTGVRMRDAMRNGRFLTINGNQYPVVLDDGVFEHNNINNGNVAAGSYASSICFVPLRVRGAYPVTYWEHINYREIGRELSPMGQGIRNVPFWTDNGRFLWVYRPNGYCFDMQAQIESRIILRTPHLAGKLQNIKYSPLAHLRDPMPTSPYHLSGGVSTRTFTTGQAVWSS